MPKDKQAVFLKFGDPDGVIHPVDLAWQLKRQNNEPGLSAIPPKEHFLFTPEQKKAIDEMIEGIKKKR